MKMLFSVLVLSLFMSPAFAQTASDFVIDQWEARESGTSLGRPGVTCLAIGITRERRSCSREATATTRTSARVEALKSCSAFCFNCALYQCYRKK